MKSKKNKETNSNRVKVRGFFRIQLNEDGRVVGDSGWVENTVVNLGFDNYICQAMIGGAGSKRVTHVAVGTGGAPAAADTLLASEHTTPGRAAVVATTSGSKTVQYTGSWASALNTSSSNISNIGLFNTSATNAGQLFAGNTFTSSQWATNQDLAVTYKINFA